MRKTHHNYNPEEKISILKRQLVGRETVSDPCFTSACLVKSKLEFICGNPVVLSGLRLSIIIPRSECPGRPRFKMLNLKIGIL